MRPLPLDVVRSQAASLELETKRFYERAAARSSDAGIRQLMNDLQALSLVDVAAAAQAGRARLRGRSKDGAGVHGI